MLATLRFRSLRANFLALTLPLAFVLFVFIVGVFEYLNLKHARDSLAEKVEKLSASQSILLAEVVWKKAYDRVPLIVASIITDPDVVGVAVRDNENRSIDTFGNGWDQPDALTRTKSIIYFDDGHLVTVGKLSIVLSETHIMHEMWRRIGYEFLLAMFLLFASVASAQFAQRRTVGIALTRLLRSMESTDKNRTPVEWHRPDEVGRVVCAYNSLQQRQARYEAELEDYQQQLEERVAERTRTLTTTNEQLHVEIEERKRVERELQRLADHDILTDLPNRTKLSYRLDEAVARAQRNLTSVGVLFIDLDNFKTVNDAFGHAQGDRLIQHVAKRLRQCIRKQDVLARVGGDEFVVVVEDIRTPEQVGAIAEKILDELSEPQLLDGLELLVTPSIGISLYLVDADTQKDLIKNADIAMYQAKRGGGGRFCFYSRKLSEEIVERVSLESDLRRAIDRREFVLHYQPMVTAMDGRLMGLEALIRWRHPVRGQIGPDEFLPVAQDSGLIIPIGEWVIKQTCRQLQAWRRKGFAPCRIAINASKREIDEGRLPMVLSESLDEYGVSADLLELEITEESLLYRPDVNIRTLEEIRDLGISLAIDDFGTGYSSLSYMRYLPITKIKIDRSFINDVGDDDESLSIVRALIGLSHTLGLRVTAEGVEKQYQREILIAEGCDEIQGYLIARPCSAGRVAEDILPKIAGNVTVLTAHG